MNKVSAIGFGGGMIGMGEDLDRDGVGNEARVFFVD